MSPSPSFGARICRLLACVLLGVVKVTWVGAAATGAPMASKAEVEKVFGRFVQAWQTKNWDAVIGSFTADAIAFDFNGSGRHENTEGIRNWITDTFKSFDQVGIELRDLRVQTVGSVAWLTAGYVFKTSVDRSHSPSREICRWFG